MIKIIINMMSVDACKKAGHSSFFQTSADSPWRIDFIVTLGCTVGSLKVTLCP